MKKKLTWKTAAGLILAAGAWRRLSEDLPIDGDIIPIDPGLKPPTPPKLPPFKPTCKNDERLSWDSGARRWVCVPRL